MVGEHLILAAEEFDELAEKRLPVDSPLVRRLRAKHVIRQPGDRAPSTLLALKSRTRYRRLAESTGLHIFVVSLRCEHSCPYCQVSRQSSDKGASTCRSRRRERGLDMAFRSPSSAIKIEFQGGEPLLNFGLIEEIVRRGRAAQRDASGKNLGFVIATNLALLTTRSSTSATATTSTSRPRSTARPTCTTGTGRARAQQLGAGDRGDPARPRGARRRSRLGADDDDPGEPRPRARDRRLLPRTGAARASSCGRSRPTASRSRRRATPPTTPSAGSTSTARASTTSSS